MTDITTAAELDALLPKCRTFNEDGSGPICDQPGRYLVWGHLFAKMNKGPKCYRHLPPECKEFRPGVRGGAVFDLREFALQAIASRPDQPVATKLTEEAVAQAIEDNIWDRTPGVLRIDSARAARAVLALPPVATKPAVLPNREALIPAVVRALRDVALASRGHASDEEAAHWVTDAILAILSGRTEADVKAEGWDEGWEAGRHDALEVGDDGLFGATPNPYRADQTEGD